jgi:hypothetical protein
MLRKGFGDHFGSFGNRFVGFGDSFAGASEMASFGFVRSFPRRKIGLANERAVGGNMKRNRKRKSRTGKPAARVERRHGKRFKKKDLPAGRESRQSHVDFIMLNWHLLGALAWRGYQVEGAGAIIINARKAKELWMIGSGKVLDIGRTPCLYLSQASMDRVGGWPDVDTARMVHEYDPEEEVVLVILRSDGGVSEYRIRAPNLPNPRECHRSHGAELASRLWEDDEGK